MSLPLVVSLLAVVAFYTILSCMPRCNSAGSVLWENSSRNWDIPPLAAPVSHVLPASCGHDTLPGIDHCKNAGIALSLLLVRSNPRIPDISQALSHYIVWHYSS